MRKTCENHHERNITRDTGWGCQVRGKIKVCEGMSAKSGE